MLTVRARLFEALRAIMDALMIPPGAPPEVQQQAIAEAYGLAEKASHMEGTYDNEDQFLFEEEQAELDEDAPMP